MYCTCKISCWLLVTRPHHTCNVTQRISRGLNFLCRRCSVCQRSRFLARQGQDACCVGRHLSLSPPPADRAGRECWLFLSYHRPWINGPPLLLLSSPLLYPLFLSFFFLPLSSSPSIPSHPSTPLSYPFLPPFLPSQNPSFKIAVTADNSTCLIII